MSDETAKATLLNLGFADKSVSFIQSLIGMSDKIAAYEKGLMDANGTMKDISDKTIPDFEKAINKLGAQIDTFNNKSLAPVLDNMANFISSGGDIKTLFPNRVVFDVGTGDIRQLGDNPSLPSLERPQSRRSEAENRTFDQLDLSNRTLSEIEREIRRLRQQGLLAPANL